MDNGEGGDKKVNIIEINNKQQITVVLSVTKTGHYLSRQLIYAGQTTCSYMADIYSLWII